MEGPRLMQQVFHAGVLGQDTVQGTVFCMFFFHTSLWRFFRGTVSFFFLAPSFFHDAVELFNKLTNRLDPPICPC